MTQQNSVFISVQKATQIRIHVVVERMNQLWKVLREQPEWTDSQEIPLEQDKNSAKHDFWQYSVLTQ